MIVATLVGLGRLYEVFLFGLGLVIAFWALLLLGGLIESIWSCFKRDKPDGDEHIQSLDNSCIQRGERREQKQKR